MTAHNLKYKNLTSSELQKLLDTANWVFPDKRRVAIKEARGLQLVIDKNKSPKLRYVELNSNFTESVRDETIPDTFSYEIEKVIESSKYILDLPENWDEEGSPAYTKETWERATQFIRKTSLLFKKKSGTWVKPPKITPGPDGSIDVRWKNPVRSLLVNFPADSAAHPDFYGSDKKSDIIKGTLNLSSQNHWLLQWLNR